MTPIDERNTTVVGARLSSELRSGGPGCATVVSFLDLDPCKFGSMEEYTASLSRALKERGWQSVLVFAQSVAEEVLPKFEGTGAVFEVFDGSSKRRTYASILRILRKYRPGVVHFHFFNHFTILPILTELARPKLVVFTDHLRQPNQLSLATRLECRFWDRVVLRLLRTRVLTVSQHIKNTLVDFYQMSPKRVQVLYNGINPDRFAPPDREQKRQLGLELGLPGSDPVVVCVAHLRPEKGISDLLVAAKQILTVKPTSTFVIVGSGPLAESLQAQAQTLGIAPSVRFTGQRSDVNRFLAVADIVTVPSVWQEPGALVLSEAMASAKPVVATRVGGTPEYLEDGVTGILVPPHAPDQLAAALLRLLNSPSEAEAMGRAGRARVEKRFSTARWVEDTVRFYEKGLAPTTRTHRMNS